MLSRSRSWNGGRLLATLQLAPKFRDVSRMEQAQAMKKLKRQPLLTRLCAFFDRLSKNFALPPDALLTPGETPFSRFEARHEDLPIQAASAVTREPVSSHARRRWRRQESSARTGRKWSI